GNGTTHKIVGGVEASDRLLKINDIDSVPFPENVPLHFWIPAICLMAEMHAGLQQFLDRDRSHTVTPFRPPAYPLLRTSSGRSSWLLARRPSIRSMRTPMDCYESRAAHMSGLPQACLGVDEH